MDPYKVLGVSPGAGKDEIRRAYLELVKKYHPDKYAAGPMKDLANEKLKEVNLAYETLQKNGGSGRTASDFGFDGDYGGYGYQQPYSGPYAAELQRARQMINQGNIQGARYVLSSIPLHNGEWYYLSGIAYFRSGQYEAAREHLHNAADAAPDNAEYQTAYQTVLRNSNPYGNGGSSDDICGGGSSCCNACAGLICANFLCNCCCGR